MSSCLRSLFRPKLVEHIPGKKRIYKNIIGTKTTYTLKDINPLESHCSNGNVKRVYISGLPNDMYEADRGASVLLEDYPLKETRFSKVKSYLFGLFKGKTKTMETLNVGDRVTIRGPLTNDYKVGGITKAGGVGNVEFVAVQPFIKIKS